MTFTGMERLFDEEPDSDERRRWDEARRRVEEPQEVDHAARRSRRAPAIVAVVAMVVLSAGGAVAAGFAFTGTGPVPEGRPDPWGVIAVFAGVALLIVGVATAVRRGYFTARWNDPLQALTRHERRDVSMAIHQGIGPSDTRRAVVLRQARAIRDQARGVLWLVPAMAFLYGGSVLLVLSGEARSRTVFMVVVVTVLIPVGIVLGIREHRAAGRYLREFGADRLRPGSSASPPDVRGRS